MKLKRVLIASFVLIVLGVLFILGPNAGVTGTVIGADSRVLDNESGFLFGFFLVWLAGIMLIGGVEEKVLSIEDLDKRRKQIENFNMDYGLMGSKEFYKKLGDKKPSQLSDKEKRELGKEIFKSNKNSYLDFLGLKGKNVYASGALEDMYATQAGVSRQEIDSLGSLNPEALENFKKKSTQNLSGRLLNYSFHDVEGKNYEGLKGDLLEKLKEFKLDSDKIKGPQDVAALYSGYTENKRLKEQFKDYAIKDKKAA